MRNFQVYAVPRDTWRNQMEEASRALWPIYLGVAINYKLNE